MIDTLIFVFLDLSILYLIIDFMIHAIFDIVCIIKKIKEST